MTKTLWIGGQQEVMPAGYVAATYNLVENEIPILFPEYYDSSVRTIYKTVLPHRNLKVYVNNTQVTYTDRGALYQEIEVKERVLTGFLRFSYLPRNAVDYFGSANLEFNKTRTWIFQKYIDIDSDVINQIRIAIAAVENKMGIASTRWTGGSYTDIKSTVSGIPNLTNTYKSNIIATETLYVSTMFQEITTRLAYLSARLDIGASELINKLVVGTSLTPSWIESARTIINLMEAVL